MKPTPKPDVEATDHQLCYQLEQWFPWLLSSDDIGSNVDIVDGILNVYDAFRKSTKSTRKP